MKVKKYAVGGIQYTPFVTSYLSNITGGSTKASSSSTKSTPRDDAEIEKAIIKLADTEGIPIDVSIFNAQAAQFLKASESLTSYSPFGGTDNSYNLSTLFTLQSQANLLKQNHALWETANKNIDENNSWGDVAVDNTGRIYTITESGKIQKISPDELAKDLKNREEKPLDYTPLTYSQLMGLREKDQNFAYNSDVLRDLAAGSGMNKITTKIMNVIEKLGNEDVSGYMAKDGKMRKVIEGAQTLLAEGPDGIYKYSQTSTKGENINTLISYIYNQVLDEQDKQQWRATLAWQGGDPSRKGIFEGILNVASMHTSDKLTVDYQKDATQAVEFGGEEGIIRRKAKVESEYKKSDMVSDELPMRYSTGHGLAPRQKINIQPWNHKTALQVIGQDAGPIMQNKSEQMGPYVTLQHVSQSSYGLRGVTDFSHICFGDQVLDPQDYDEIMIDNNTNMHRVYMPVRYENGNPVPDFALNTAIEEFQTELRKKNVTDPGLINTKLQEMFPGQGLRYNAETKAIDFPAEKMMAFMVLEGYASDKLTDIDKRSPYIYHLEPDEGKKIKDTFNNLIQTGDLFGKTNAGKDKRVINDVGNAGKNRLYRSNIFIPIAGNGVMGAAIYGPQYAPYTRYMNITGQASLHQDRMNGVSSGQGSPSSNMKLNW